ncbi:hypothetical protein HanXRQr2_Chr17g0807601 [Helianthus annuus]|nr:hypothetical protein HanXRQr2_Chr17g0807601 [Helianthus annuus]
MVKAKDKAGSSSSKQPQGEEEQPKKRRLTRVGDRTRRRMHLQGVQNRIGHPVHY